MADWLEKVREVQAQARTLEERLADPALASKRAELVSLGKELAELRPVLEAGRRYEENQRALADARALADDADPEMAELARSELAELEAAEASLLEELKAALRPRDPNDSKASWYLRTANSSAHASSTSLRRSMCSRYPTK